MTFKIEMTAKSEGSRLTVSRSGDREGERVNSGPKPERTATEAAGGRRMTVRRSARLGALRMTEVATRARRRLRRVARAGRGWWEGGIRREAVAPRRIGYLGDE